MLNRGLWVGPPRERPSEGSCAQAERSGTVRKCTHTEAENEAAAQEGTCWRRGCSGNHVFRSRRQEEVYLNFSLL